VRDLETIMTELCLKDLVFFRKAMDNEEQYCKKHPKHSQTPDYRNFVSTMAKVEDHLTNNRGIYAQVRLRVCAELCAEKKKAPLWTQSEPNINQRIASCAMMIGHMRGSWG
jgi:ribosome-binding ATPase YchF (GTP1/OBG family)